MSHFLALVLVPRDEPAIEDRVAALLDPFFAEREVAPYREYLPARYPRRAAERHGLPPTDRAAIAERLTAELGEAIHFDARGFYAWSTVNPDAKCDGWRIGGSYDGAIFGAVQQHNLTPSEYQARYGFAVVKPENNIRPVAALPPDLLPYAIVTPDGAWSDRAGKDEARWRREARALLDRHRDYLAVAVDCHC